MYGSAKMIIVQTHFKMSQSRHILLQIKKQGCDAIQPIEASPHKLLYKCEH